MVRPEEWAVTAADGGQGMSMNYDLKPSYGGVVLRRGSEQIVCLTGDDVVMALRDDGVIYDPSEMCPDLYQGTLRAESRQELGLPLAAIEEQRAHPVNPGGAGDLELVGESIDLSGVEPVIFNVHDFGAVGDGVTDDTAAFERASEAAKAHGASVIHMRAGHSYKMVQS
jgi:hypothetical protein